MQCGRDEGKINAEPQASVFFGHEENTVSSRRGGWMNITLLKSLSHVLFHGFLFGMNSEYIFPLGTSSPGIRSMTVPWSVRG